MLFRKRIPIHPIILSVYPVLMVIAYNLSEFLLSEGLRPLVFAFVGGLILWLFIQVLVKDWSKSGIISSMALMFFYSYGHIYYLLKQNNIGDFVVARHRYLLPIMVGLLTYGVIWVLKKLQNSQQITEMLNRIAVILLIFPTFQIASYEFNAVIDKQRNQILVDFDPDSEVQTSEYYPKPDVYLIVLDAYTRQDTLQTQYGFDNSFFIN